MTDLIVDTIDKLDKIVGDRFEPQYERGQEIVNNSVICNVIGGLVMLVFATVGSLLILGFGIFLCLVGAAAAMLEDFRDRRSK